MTARAMEISKMVDMLPDEEQALTYELVKRVVLAWDPDFTKVTPEERKRIEDAEREFERGEYCTENEIDWN